MSVIITQIIDSLPEPGTTVQLRRNEDLFLTVPAPRGPRPWQKHDPLSVCHFAQIYTPAKFSPPRDVYGGDDLRLEWQQMEGRQPFYHRNADVDEISLQVSGDRTLMTELGTTELRRGDFSRIPVAIAHDNYGRSDVHLLFYMHGPVRELGEVVSQAEALETPFQGWEAAPNGITEVMTECMGAGGCDIAVSLVDEALLLQGGLQRVTRSMDPATTTDAVVTALRVVKPLVDQNGGATADEADWLYQSSRVLMGQCRLREENGLTYRTHRRAAAVHYQMEGRRTLISTHGIVQLEPGDFVAIPKGCSYTSVCAKDSSHIVLLTVGDLELKGPVARTAEPVTVGMVASIREGKR